MTRTIDWRCEKCDIEILDALADEDEVRACRICSEPMEQIWWRRRTRNAQWDDTTAVMVLVNDDPSCPSDVRTRYPGRHDCRVPVGYHRVYLRSLAEVGKFEREHHVAVHAMHYDCNGRALDDKMVGTH